MWRHQLEKEVHDLRRTRHDCFQETTALLSFDVGIEECVRSRERGSLDVQLYAERVRLTAGVIALRAMKERVLTCNVSGVGAVADNS